MKTQVPFESTLQLTEVMNTETFFDGEMHQESVIQLSEQEFEKMIIYLELHSYLSQFKNGIDPSRNYCYQYDLLDKLPYNITTLNPQVKEYWEQKTERLKRPLLRVFMRAVENDKRLSVAYRPSRPYKQKRLKRLFSDLADYQLWNSIYKNETLIGLEQLDRIRKRESIKREILQVSYEQWKEGILELEEQAEEMILETPVKRRSDECFEKFKELKEIKKLYFQKDDILESNKTIKDIPKPRPEYEKYNQCEISECAFDVFKSLPKCTLQTEVVELLDDQLTRLKNRQLVWPKQPTVLRDATYGDTLIINSFNKIGVKSDSHQISMGSFDRHVQIYKRQKKKCKIMVMDTKTNRSSIADGARADFAHFFSHSKRWVDRNEQSIKEIQKQKQEKIRKHQTQLMKLKKDEEKKNCLKIKIKKDQMITAVDVQDTRIVMKRGESGQLIVS